MFYMLPPVLNLVVLLLPIVGFRVYDFRAFKRDAAYLELRQRHRSYWVYRTAAPRNPPLALYALQAVWAALMLVPFG